MINNIPIKKGNLYSVIDYDLLIKLQSNNVFKHDVKTNENKYNKHAVEMRKIKIKKHIIPKIHRGEQDYDKC